MTSVDPREVIHADHRHRQDEIRMWREDVAAWRNEQKSLLGQLEKVAGALVGDLNEHAESIGVHEGEVGHHERFIAECEKTARNGGADEEGLRESHENEAAEHAAQRDAHERFKKHHYQLMAGMQHIVADRPDATAKVGEM